MKYFFNLKKKKAFVYYDIYIHFSSEVAHYIHEYCNIGILKEILINTLK